MKTKNRSFFFASPLRDKILVMFLLLSAAPALLLGWLTILFLDQTHRHDVKIIEEEALNAAEEEVKKYFSTMVGILDLRLEAINAEEISAEIVSWQKQLAEAMRKSHTSFVEIIFVSPEGKETARSSRDKREGPLLYVSDLPAFQTAREGTPYIGNVYYTTAGPRITLASPVRAGSSVVQVVIAEADISDLVRSITAHRFGETGYIVLADSQNTYVGERPLGSIKPGDNISSILKYAAAQSRYESIFSAAAVAAATTPVSPVNWMLIAEWPLAEADAVLNDIRNQIILVVIFSIFGVVLAAPLFAARIVQPIRVLEQGAQRIEQGDFETTVAVSTKDELEDLGTTFNTMARGLKRLAELKNEFVFIAAHELRAPTTIIKGYISMILEGSAGIITKDTKEFLERVSSANQQLLQLVSDLLEIARSEAGRIEIHVSSLDIRNEIDSVASEVTPLTHEKQITIRYERPPAAVMVQADSTRVKEVILNFVTNAIKYNREHGTITILHEEKQSEIITHVRDTGFGIPKEEQKKIFEKFYRTAKARTSGIQGTGLGLFITKELVERMGGKVWFESKESVGTTFSFSLPKRNDTIKK